MPTEEEVKEKLKSVVDPHTGTDVYSMGLISDIKIDDSEVSLTFTPTSPFCPMGIQLAVMIKKNLLELEDVEEQDIDITVKGHINAEQINEKLSTQRD
ncbi:MAG: metal-sulfur cluster assembly factor [Thermoplasmatota archaeon]